MKNLKNITLLLLVAAVATLSSCKKDTKDLIIGKWTNTAESCQIDIGGLQAIPADCITMEFTADKVLVSDIRTNRLPTEVGYTLSEKDGKQILHFDGPVCLPGLLDSNLIVEKIDKDQMVLACNERMIDWDFHYVMTRSK